MTQTATVTPAGGSVSATLGSQTVTVLVPSGALSGAGTITLTVYGTSPHTLQATARRVQSIGAHATLLVAFSVSVTGATLLKPLQAQLTTPAAAAGSIFRLAGFGSAFDDVDTVTWSAGTATSDLNVAFARMSLAAPLGGTLYAFYTEPQAEAGNAPTPVITVSTAATQPLGMFATAQFTATELSPNGFPYLDPHFTFSVDTVSLGTVDPNTGAFTAGAVDGTGNVVVTDATNGRGNPSGKRAVTVSSQRPGTASDTFKFTGTLSSTVQLVNSNPTQPQTDAATVALTSTVNGFTPATGGGKSAVHTAEVDTYPRMTLTTGTDSAYLYATSGTQANLSILSSDAKDSNGVEYVTQYGSGNGLLDVLPETPGAFGPNTAALTYAETDPANFSRQRTAAADGSYGESGKDPLGHTQTITVNPDLSAQYDLRQIEGRRYTMSAPSAGHIIVTVFDSSGAVIQAFNIPSWIPSGMTLPSTETDSDDGVVSYPASCGVPAKYGTSGTRITQTVQRADTALGNLETLTTTTYTAPRVGPVCMQLQDSVKTFYDFTGQNGLVLLVSGGTVNLQQTTISETLTLQSASVESGTATLANGRRPSSLSSTPAGMATLSFARARFEHAVRDKLNWMRKQSFDPNFLSHGVTTL